MIGEQIKMLYKQKRVSVKKVTLFIRLLSFDL